MTNPSPEQLAFFSAIRERSDSILLNAKAGSGKTTTSVHSTTLLPQGYATFFLAFNKRIAEELQTRVARNVRASTFHSLGFAALRRHLPKSPALSKDKTRDLLMAATKSKDLPWKDFEAYSAFACKLVSLAKSAGLGILFPETKSEWEALVSHHCLTLDSGDPDRGIEIASRLLAESNSITSKIDFDDMLYLPLLLNANFDKAQFLYVDEAQDTNLVQSEIIARSMTETSRLFAVGDPNQAIYGFRGADSSAMSNLKSRFNMTEMPLSVSFRCSKAVVAEAQKYLK